jgi:uncharacterized protein (TIGR02145 family)
MKTKIILSFVALAVMASAYGQNSTFELTFTAVDSASYVQLDSIKVMNRTQGGDTVLYFPDTVLVLVYLGGITEVSLDKTGLQVFQNYPNPVEDQTTITLYVPEKGEVDLMITDMIGRQVIHNGRVLDKGYHSFSFTPGIGNLFFFTAHWKGKSSSIKILHSATDSHQAGSLEYIGNATSSQQFKATEAVQTFSITRGDTLLYIGYSNELQSGMLDTPETSETFIFQFATNIPCPGIPTVTYEGQVYNTIQIFSQCWLKENLNVGTMIPGTQNMSNNSVIEKYCYDDKVDSCTKYGGLYQWNEMMQYDTTQGVQGICPPGWHIPTLEEYRLLNGAVDSQFGIGDPEWEGYGFNGFDAGTNLKTTSGWIAGGNGTDLVGFSCLPGGLRHENGSFATVGLYGYENTSTEYNSINAWLWGLSYIMSGVRVDPGPGKAFGFSVRCMKD